MLDPSALQVSPPATASPARIESLDPALVDIYRHYGRDPRSLQSGDYMRLKESVCLAGGVAVPILVRAVSDGRYELAFGRLRHHACLELEIPIWAVVQRLSEHELVQAMLCEQLFGNRLSTFELVH